MKNMLFIVCILLLMVCIRTVQSEISVLLNNSNEEIEKKVEKLTNDEKQVIAILEDVAVSKDSVFDFVEKLVQIGEPAKKLLVEALYNENKQVVNVSTKALARICGEEALPHLIKAFVKQINKPTITFLYLEISNFKEKALPELLKILNNDDEYVRYMVVMLIGEIDGSEDKLREHYKKEKSNVVKLQIIRNLYRTNSDIIKEHLDFVHEMLKDDDEFTKCVAIYIVGKVKDETQIDFLIKCINDKSVNIRLSAMSALCDFGSEKAVNAVLNALKHEDYITRYNAAEDLSLVNSEDENTEKKIIKGLIEALNDNNKDVRESVINALSRFDDLDIIPHLEKLAKNDPEEKLRELAKNVIRVIKRNKANSDKEKEKDPEEKDDETDD